MHWLWWALLSALFAGCTAYLAKLGVEKIDSDLATAIRTTIILFVVWAIAAARSSQPIGEISRQSWLYLTLSALATGASWLCYFQALKLGPVSSVAPIDKLSVVVAMALGALLLYEKLTWRDWLGGGLIVAGAIVIATKLPAASAE
jgi:transporter family protein